MRRSGHQIPGIFALDHKGTRHRLAHPFEVVGFVIQGPVLLGFKCVGVGFSLGRMNAQDFIEVSRDAVWVMIKLGAIPMLAGLAVGVIIGRTSEFFDFFVYAIASESEIDVLAVLHTRRKYPPNG